MCNGDFKRLEHNSFFLLLKFREGWKDFKTEKWRVPRNIHGIFHDFNVGYMLDVWEARKLCKHVFADLWGTDDLLCSFDGIGFVPKGTKWPDVNACWYHLDQGVSKQGLRCIQGRAGFC